MFKQLSVPLFRKTTKLPPHKELSFDSQEIYDIFVGELKGDREWADRVTTGEYKRRYEIMVSANQFIAECKNSSPFEIDRHFRLWRGCGNYEVTDEVMRIASVNKRAEANTIGMIIFDYVNANNQINQLQTNK